MKLNVFQVPLFIILAGVAFSLYLQGQVPDGVYFSGDAGLKALLAKQLSSGILRFDLVPPSETWISQLWNRGLYPYAEPFVYQVGSRYYITFPFTFPLVTAPLQALFGDRGLYLIPLLSTWGIWLVFYRTCQHLKFTSWGTSLGLAILIFASPLTVYSAMYWEHTLAVFLAFLGLAVLLNSQETGGVSKKQAVLSGIAIGLSVWFRPEFLCLIGLLIILVYGVYFSQFKAHIFNNQLSAIAFIARHKEILVASMILIVGIFFILNYLIYQHPLGIHAIQVVEQSSLSEKISNFSSSFKGLSGFLFSYFTIAYFLVFYLLLYGFRRREVKFTLPLTLIYIACLLFVVGVSLLVPPGTAGLIPGGKQWGPRFLLILMPIISLVAVKEWLDLKATARPLLRYLGMGILAVLLIVSIQKNTYLATLYLKNNHQGVLPALTFVQKNPNRIIAISHQFVGQVLEPALNPDKIFFKVDNLQALKELSVTLSDRNDSKFLYICYPFSPCKIPQEAPDRLKFSDRDQELNVQFQALGKLGKYAIYQASITPR
jgi:hypothetical protein